MFDGKLDLAHRTGAERLLQLPVADYTNLSLPCFPPQPRLLLSLPLPLRMLLAPIDGSRHHSCSLFGDGQRPGRRCRVRGVLLARRTTAAAAAAAAACGRRRRRCRQGRSIVTPGYDSPSWEVFEVPCRPSRRPRRFSTAQRQHLRPARLYTLIARPNTVPAYD